MATSKSTGAPAPDQPMTKQELLEKYGNLTKENFTPEALDEIIRAVFAMPGEGPDAILSAMREVKPELFEEDIREMADKLNKLSPTD